MTPLIAWPSSTDSQETSSDGPSPQDSKRRSVLVQWDKAWGAGALSGHRFYSTATHTGDTVSFMAYGDGDESLRRILGCILLGAMPPEGLEEAIDSLKEILEFRLENERLAQLRTQPAVQYGLGTIVHSGPRPNLVLAE